MNEVSQSSRSGEAIRVASEIVDRHRPAFPAFITDFRITLGYSDGDPAVFVLLKAVGEDGPWPSTDWQARADAYRALEDALIPELIEAIDGRFPYTVLVPDWRWESLPD